MELDVYGLHTATTCCWQSELFQNLIQLTNYNNNNNMAVRLAEVVQDLSGLSGKLTLRALPPPILELKC
jgi:hypothetical protein